MRWSSALQQAEIGIIGGSGLYSMPGLSNAREERFSPALRDGVPVATTFSFTTRFRLDTP